MVFSFRTARLALPVSAIALSLGLFGCPSTTTPTAPTAAGGSAAPAGTAPAAGGPATDLKGAGATAPYPLYQKWFSEYSKTKPGTVISYESIGSGAGVKQFLAETVDFGATDSPLKDDEKAKVPAKRGKAIQVPTTGLFVVFAYNLEGVPALKLSRESFCGIVDGTIKTWNDPKLVKDNAGVTLPASPVAFVYRSDGSGTTSIFTKHIEKACPNWKAGSGKTVEWSGGTGAKGNDGVTAQIQQTKGSIGYTEFSFAKENNLSMAAIQNKAGEFIVPTPEAAAKALSGVTIPADFAVSVPDPEAKDAYPIVSLTWLLLYSQYDDAAKADTLKSMIKWALADGKKATEELGYIPLPAEVITKVLAEVDTIKAGK
jgi:phosphate transport system substrate-binding protein